MILKLFIYEKRKYMGQINLEQLSKFSKAGPRYTSYPTAIEFKDTPD